MTKTLSNAFECQADVALRHLGELADNCFGHHVRHKLVHFQKLLPASYLCATRERMIPFAPFAMILQPPPGFGMAQLIIFRADAKTFDLPWSAESFDRPVVASLISV